MDVFTKIQFKGSFFQGQIIWCSKGSYTHSWAQQNKQPFVLTDGTDEENHFSGSFGKYSWDLDKKTGLLKINGTGSLPEFGTLGAPWKDLKNYVTKIIYSNK